MEASVASTNPSPGSSRSPTGLPRGIVAPDMSTSDSASLKGTPIPSQSTSVIQDKRTAIFIQDECVKHRFIRSRDTSGVFEHPERLRAVKLGLAAAISHIEDVESATDAQKIERASPSAVTDEGDLAAALARMKIAPTYGSDASSPGPSSLLRTSSVLIRRTTATVSLLDHPAVKYVHGDIERDRDVYLEILVTLARDSRKNIKEKGTEIPEGTIPPLDLYLCPGSIDAIRGAIGAVCEAVDASVTATRRPCPPSRGPDDPCERAFVVIRPPGHHCGEDTPSGFCLINNVAVGAVHAHLNHDIQRIVILDIDLHHGNGTQSIIWKINEETYLQSLEDEIDTRPQKPGPRIFYGSLHDILSFPCEEGKPGMVQAASTSIHGPHGQYIENIHLQRYNSEAHFWDVLFPRYLTLIHRARDFLDETGGPGDDVIMFISCGFDAGEHEYPAMSRHNRKVPVGFYHRFTREVCTLADTYARGRVISVLEGGYSDRALTSGAMAHLCGLVDVVARCQDSGPASPDLERDTTHWVDDAWWSEDNLVKLEKAVKPRNLKSVSARVSTDPWVVRTVDLLSALDGSADASVNAASSAGGSGVSAWAPQTSMTLRERKKPMVDSVARTGGALPSTARVTKREARSVSTSGKPSMDRTRVSSTELGHGEEGGQPDAGIPPGGVEKKKLPRVILHVRPPAETG